MDLSKADGLKFVVRYKSRALPTNLAGLKGCRNLTALPADDLKEINIWYCEDIDPEDTEPRTIVFRRCPPPGKIQYVPGQKLTPEFSQSSEFNLLELSEENLVAVRPKDSQNWISPEEYLEILKSEGGVG